ncbi:serine protease [Panus rudis PR-1116 ss-1]|nr:serine protease [Panus rudis PR-1116 ss-1]
MRILAVIIASLALLAPCTLSVPTVPLATVHKYAGQVKEHSYIVTLKNGVSKEDQLDWIRQNIGNSSITHDEWRSDVLHGYAGTFHGHELDVLRANPDIQTIEEDGIMHTTASPVTQNDAPWGLARMSQDAPIAGQNEFATNNTYEYNNVSASGVDVYVIGESFESTWGTVDGRPQCLVPWVDTGIHTNHTQFDGRARWGVTFGGYPDADGAGHGTHVAGIVGSRQFGVAKSVNLIAVKVLSDQGSGTLSDIMSGINWVVNATQMATSRRPSIINLSLGGPPADSLDNAVAAATNLGIHVVVAAGNSAMDARSTSPARAPSANTVGASTIGDSRAYFSNFGPAIDIFSPGLDVLSTWIGASNATKVLSGTSMASPYVAGLLAYLLSSGENLSPSAATERLQRWSLKGVLSDTRNDTINALARNDV